MLEEEARQLGPIPSGGFRVVVIESDLRIASIDFESFDRARSYADDACSETESDTPPVAAVFDDQFRLVHEGRAYCMPRGS